MMEQDKYPDFHSNYRQLRSEGVKFPDRDPNERLMMEGISAVESPMFDFIEQKAGRVKPEPLQKVKEEQIEDFVEKEQVFEDQKEDFSIYVRGPVN